MWHRLLPPVRLLSLACLSSRFGSLSKPRRISKRSTRYNHQALFLARVTIHVKKVESIAHLRRTVASVSIAECRTLLPEALSVGGNTPLTVTVHTVCKRMRAQRPFANGRFENPRKLIASEENTSHLVLSYRALNGKSRCFSPPSLPNGARVYCSSSCLEPHAHGR